MFEYLLPIDLGRFQDYSALHLMKVVPVRQNLPVSPGKTKPIYEKQYHVLYQERTTEKYVQLVKKVHLILSQPKFKDNTVVIVDATGVGGAVIEMFQTSPPPIAVVIHGGDTLTVREDPPGYNVPKSDIVASMQVVLQTRRLKIKNNLPYNEQLIKELQNYTMKLSQATGHDLYSNLKDSIHDDMVTSIALGCWYGEKFIPTEIYDAPMVAPGYDPIKKAD